MRLWWHTRILKHGYNLTMVSNRVGRPVWIVDCGCRKTWTTERI